MSAIKNVKLGFSCPNTKESFNKTTNGYNCSACSKKVIDFTNKSQTELLQILKSSSSNVCGIFNSSQINKNFIKYAATTALIGSSFVFNAQGQQTIKVDTVEQACEITENILIGEVVSNYDETTFNYPEPIGGMEKFYEAIMQHVRYPDSLKVNGRTFIRFAVDTTGSITTVEVLKGFNRLADEEAVRAVKATSFPFKPASREGMPVESRLVIPVNFKRE